MSTETRTSTSRNSWRLETPGAPAWPHSARPGAAIERIYYCPHDPHAARGAYRQTCDCRKPAAGMLRQAAADLDLDLRVQAQVHPLLGVH